MSDPVSELSARHQALLDLIESAEQGSLVAEAQEFVAQLAKSGADIGDPRERSQVRALMRFWSSFIYDRTGRFPEIELLPATAIASQRE